MGRAQGKTIEIPDPAALRHRSRHGSAPSSLTTKAMATSTTQRWLRVQHKVGHERTATLRCLGGPTNSPPRISAPASLCPTASYITPARCIEGPSSPPSMGRPRSSTTRRATTAQVGLLCNGNVNASRSASHAPKQDKAASYRRAFISSYPSLEAPTFRGNIAPPAASVALKSSGLS